MIFMIFYHLFSISHWNLQAFMNFVTKHIKDNYKIYSLIIIIIERIVIIVRCGVFKISKVNHLTMFLPMCIDSIHFVNFHLPSLFVSQSNYLIIHQQLLPLWLDYATPSLWNFKTLDLFTFPNFHMDCENPWNFHHFLAISKFFLLHIVEELHN
jgi:hypothetical protein